jgi:hypothetical protein
MSLGDIRDCAPCKPYLSTSSTFVYPFKRCLCHFIDRIAQVPFQDLITVGMAVYAVVVRF